MDSIEIQARVDALSKAMTAKGLREPVASLSFESHKVEASVCLRWTDVTKLSGRYSHLDHSYEFIKASTLIEAFDKADEFVAALPSADEAKMKQFMGALANVIDLGRTNGIEVEFLNPLQATMKSLSENVLTDQRAA